MDDYLANTFYAQRDHNVVVACSQCIDHALCLFLEHKGLTRDEYIKGYIYNG